MNIEFFWHSEIFFKQIKREKTATSVCDIYIFQLQNWTLQVSIKSKTNILDVIFHSFLACLIRHACMVYILLLFLFSAPVYICHTLTTRLLTIVGFQEIFQF